MRSGRVLVISQKLLRLVQLKFTSPSLQFRGAHNVKVIPSLFELDINASQACDNNNTFVARS